MGDIRSLLESIDELPISDRQRVLRHLRDTLPPHPMEARLKVTAEALLEAIGRASPLTIRGIEGILAEASFATDVLPTLKSWTELALPSDAAFDFLLTDQSGAPPVRLQVKMQRRRNHLPLMASDVLKSRRAWPNNFFVVEAQRTRGGEDSQGQGTRPYRFGEFDILAVSLGASLGRWSYFIYTIADWLLPDPDDRSRILKYQPVAPVENDDWTTTFGTAAVWLRSGKRKTIAG